MQEPFRRSLGNAIQWFDVLQVDLDRRVDSILSACRQRIKDALVPDRQDPTPLPAHSPRPDCPPDFDNPILETSFPIRIPESCAPLLVQRCPACFGGHSFGRALRDGADIHVATDGNFHHRHRRSSGDRPLMYEPIYFLPKAQVDAVGRRIEKARKRPIRHRQTHVPDEAVDQCESSYEAADGKKQKTSTEIYDDTGVMALICRHDIPLFFTNIDTPGEQQKYSIALIEHLFTFLPAAATVVVMYDIGCVIERSITRVCHLFYI